MHSKLQIQMQAIDEAAERTGSPLEFYGYLATALKIWTSGGVPAAGWLPISNPILADLHGAWKRFKDDLVEEIEFRAFSAA